MNDIEWDVVYFEYVGTRSIETAAPILPWREQTVGRYFYAANCPFVPKAIQLMEEFGERPLRHPLGGAGCRDGAYNKMRKAFSDMKIFLANPSLAGHRSSRTVIWDLKIYNQIRWLQFLVNGMRKEKNRMVARHGGIY